MENLTISNITPYGFRVSWKVKQQQRQRSQRQELAPSSGSFSHFHVVVTDSGWLLEPQEFTVPGNQSHLDVSGLITGIGYEVRVTGVSDSGLLSRPLTTVAVTGTTLREALRQLRPLGNSAMRSSARYTIATWQVSALKAFTQSLRAAAAMF